jgi:hypothetical protein
MFVPGTGVLDVDGVEHYMINLLKVGVQAVGLRSVQGVGVLGCCWDHFSGAAGGKTE